MKIRLLTKLLAINLPLIVAVIAGVWVAIDYLAADYFMVLMDKYHVNPAETHAMFLDAVHRYMVWASAAGLVAAVGVSALLTRRLLKPLYQMAEVSRRIALGEYDQRVAAASGDEVGELGRAFNAMAENLARIEQLRKTMVADVAHELRTPLTNVRGYLEGLRDGVVQPDQKTYAMLNEEVLRLVNLVNDLGELSRADAAGLVLNPETVDLADALRSARELSQPCFDEKDLKAVVTIGPGVTTVRADPARLAQILRNLLDNACRHAPRGGRVELFAGRENHKIRIGVENTGEPIPADDLPLIFERFYRVDKSRARSSGGSGVGLAIVRQLAEAHGGSTGADCPEGRVRVWVELLEHATA
ncbi:MAG: ATP-binding protein [Nitrospirota bacterium]|nr:ATP-binding protein [Nitrospirota bacterium]